MTSVIDGYSRAVVHQEIREQMTEQDIETILQRVKEIHDERDRKTVRQDAGSSPAGSRPPWIGCPASEN